MNKQESNAGGGYDYQGTGNQSVDASNQNTSRPTEKSGGGSSSDNSSSGDTSKTDAVKSSTSSDIASNFSS